MRGYPLETRKAEIIRREYPKRGSSIALKLGLTPQQVINWAYHNKIKLDQHERLVPLSLLEWQKGYIAGMIDGEGSIGIYYQERNGPKLRIHPQFSSRVSIANTNADVIQWLKGVISKSYIIKSNPKGRRKVLYTLRVDNVVAVYGLLLSVRDFLIIKRQQADILLNFTKRRVISGHGYQIRELDYREREEILKLNRITGHSGDIKWLNCQQK